eukprot:m.196199 g.196199  ORF g.196199 m.196199 type:complete len:379 (+) comp17649_c0_seq2:321-1457(+)
MIDFNIRAVRSKHSHTKTMMICNQSNRAKLHIKRVSHVLPRSFTTILQNVHKLLFPIPSEHQQLLLDQEGDKGDTAQHNEEAACDGDAVEPAVQVLITRVEVHAKVARNQRAKADEDGDDVDDRADHQHGVSRKVHLEGHQTLCVGDVALQLLDSAVDAAQIVEICLEQLLWVVVEVVQLLDGFGEQGRILADASQVHKEEVFVLVQNRLGCAVDAQGTRLDLAELVLQHTQVLKHRRGGCRREPLYRCEDVLHLRLQNVKFLVNLPDQRLQDDLHHLELKLDVLVLVDGNIRLAQAVHDDGQLVVCAHREDEEAAILENDRPHGVDADKDDVLADEDDRLGGLRQTVVELADVATVQQVGPVSPCVLLLRIEGGRPL